MTRLEFVRQRLSGLSGNIGAAIQLLDDGATVPFIARYRKEWTGGLDEVALIEIQGCLRQFGEIEARKLTILNSIEEQEKLSPKLKAQIENTFDKLDLEELYLPYKRKRKTRADVAKELGLEGLAKLVMAQREQYIRSSAQRWVRGEVADVDQALAGARDIIAEWVSENLTIRSIVQEAFEKFAVISAQVKKIKDPKKLDEAKQYKDYWQYTDRLSKIPGHRLLAIRRGEHQGILSLNIDVETDRLLPKLYRYFIKSKGECADQIEKAVSDAYQRLIKPSIENKFATLSKEAADKEAIGIFSKNLRNLLLEAPLGQLPVLAIDPGFRTGCKVVVLDAQGNLLEYATIYPHPPQEQTDAAGSIITQLMSRHKIKAIAIGNGTAGRETEAFIKGLGLSDVEVYFISEAGASIYSASEIARSEFPDLDLTIRGAVSIGRRLKDPLAELIKIDPKSIGVGQYQHDVNQAQLKASLEDTIISCVNAVGVNLNTASEYLLMYISGLGPTLAKRIIEFRSQKGQFTDRAQLMQVKGLGAKAYEQAAGFLRVKNSKHPLDDSAIHPERYAIVEQMAQDLHADLANLVGNASLVDQIQLDRYLTNDVGLPTLRDIIQELKKPGIDPRGQAEVFDFDPYIQQLSDIKPGMRLPGIIVNVAKFGAFVDLGIKENGLIHVSEISNRFIQDANEVLTVNQKVVVKVVEVDIDRSRLQLSLKD